MKILGKADKRSKHDYQKQQDDAWSRACRQAKLTVQQQIIIGSYLDREIGDKIHEIVSAVKCASYIYLREKYEFGAQRLRSFNRGVSSLLNDSYGRETVDANGKNQQWDGCGIEHLEQKLKNLGIKPEDVE